MPIVFSVESVCSSGIAELFVWSPPQGTEWHSIPLLIDLTFFEDVVDLPTMAVRVTSREAIVNVLTNSFQGIRGSKFGGEVLAPYEVASFQESCKKIVEAEAVVEGEGFFDFVIGYAGKISAKFRRKKSRTKEIDFSLASDLKMRRVVPITNNRWKVIEPTGRQVLSGQYIGGVSEEKLEPLWMLQMLKESARLDVYVSFDQSRLSLAVDDKMQRVRLSRAKEAVIAQIIGRAIPKISVSKEGVQLNLRNSEFIVAKGSLRAVKDE